MSTDLASLASLGPSHTLGSDIHIDHRLADRSLPSGCGFVPGRSLSGNETL